MAVDFTAHLQPAAACVSSAIYAQGKSSRHTRVYNQHNRAFSSFDMFQNSGGGEDSSNHAQDTVGNALDNSIPGQHHSKISLMTQECEEISSSHHKLPYTTFRPSLGDNIDVISDKETTCSSKPSHDGAIMEEHVSNFGINIAVPLIPLRDTVSNGVKGYKDSVHLGNEATADFTAKQFYADHGHAIAEQKKHDLDRLRSQLAALPSRPRPAKLDFRSLATYMKSNGHSKGLRKLLDPKRAPEQEEKFRSGTNVSQTKDERMEGVRLDLHVASFVDVQC